MDAPDIGYPPTIPSAIRRATSEFGGHEFIVMPDRRMTYAEADRASCRVAKALLAVGVGKGTRVGVMDTFGTDWVVAMLAITRIGAVFMPFASTYRPAELQRGLQFGDVDTLIVPPHLLGRDMADMAEAAVPGLDKASDPNLFLEALPYLRRVLVAQPCTRPWAGSISLAFGDSVDEGDHGVSDELLIGVEHSVCPSDFMAVIFTSGATSDPKGVVHTHGAQVRHGWNLAHRFGAGTRPDERVFCALPFFWIGGLSYQLMGALAVGSTVLCTERFTPEAALDLMERERATRMVGWGSQISAVSQHPTFAARNLSSAPMFLPRSGPESDPGLRHTSLGMTETSGPHTACPPDEAGRVLPEEMRGSFGRPLPFVHHQIVDPETGARLGDGEAGELCVRGYNVMDGLYKRERNEVFDADGWYHTGDRCVFRDGYLYYLGRLGEMIKSGGANVSPREIEAVIELLPSVQTAIVMGLPDAERGEIVAAVVVPANGAEMDVELVLDHARRQVSGFKVPRRIVVLAEEQVPWLPTGKPDKQALAAMLLPGGDAPSPGSRS